MLDKISTAKATSNPNKRIPNPIDVHVGSRIRLRRNMIGLSQEKLGESLGITFQQVQKYEKGTNRVGASRLQAIATTLEVQPSYFFEDAPSAQTGDRTQEDDVVAFMHSGIGIELNKAFMAIKDGNARRKILSVIKLVAAQSESSTELTAETQH